MFPTTQGLSDLFFKMKFLYPSVCRLVVSLVGRSAKVFLKGGKLNFHTPIVALFVLPWMGSFFLALLQRRPDNFHFLFSANVNFSAIKQDCIIS